MEGPETNHLHCPLCGRLHHAVPLRRGQRAVCVNCGGTLTSRPGSRQAALAFTVTALILALPAVQLPLVTVRKFGAEHSSYLWTGVQALWQDGRVLLAIWVALCGLVVPLTLLATLTMLVFASRRHADGAERLWTRLASALQHWSMPEVQVLAVLVAFVKIGALVQVQPGAGLWFYAAMTTAMLFAWRAAGLLEEP